MKKIILLLMLLFFVSGCSVEYNLAITSDNLIESINVISENENDSVKVKNYAFPVNVFYNDSVNSESFDKIEGVEYYEKNLYQTNYTNCNLKYTFNFDDFEENNFLNSAYNKFEFSKSNKIYTLKTNAENKIMKQYNLSNIKVKITLDSIYNSTYNNADSVNGNVYIWNITKDNFKPITLSFTKEEETQKKDPNINNNSEKKDDKQNDEVITIINEQNEGLVIGLIFALFIIVIVTFIYLKKKK